MTLSALEQRVGASIAARESALIEDLRRHVAIPTGPGGAAGLDETRAIFSDRLRAIGAQVRLEPGDPREAWIGAGGGGSKTDAVPPTLIARRWGAGVGAKVLLGGHLDTVHPAGGEFRDLVVSSDRTKAVGPGCVDMKGGLVILLGALEAIEAAGVPAAWGVVLNSDEETGSYHSDRAIRAEAGAGYAAGLVVEPALPDGSLVTHRPGSGQFMFEARGTPAHVGRDFLKGASAISAMAKAITQADALSDPASPPAGRGWIVNIGVVDGGTATNVVAGAARAWGNIRFPDSHAGAALESQLASIGHGGPHEPVELKVRTSVNRPAKPLTAGTMALAERARAAATDLGQAMPFSTTGGVCDGNNMQAAGLPTIDTLGVRGGGLHTPQEWIELRSVVERCQLLAVLVMRLCGA